jgi:hypothetical protein
MLRLLAAAAVDPWVLTISALGAGGAWAVGIPVAVSAGLGVGMVGAGAVAVTLSGNAELKAAPDRTVLRSGTNQAELVAALDGYILDLADLLGRRGAAALPEVVKNPAIEALTAARDSRSVAAKVALAIDTLEDAIERNSRLNSRWHGARTSAAIEASAKRMEVRRAALVEKLSNTVGEFAELYTKLLEVSVEVESVDLNEGVTDVGAINDSLDSLRAAVAELEQENKDPLSELEGPTS